jgi:mannose-6-phosphate isomerase-like protein (cupin superfamily)
MLGPGRELMPPRPQPLRGVPGAQGAGVFHIRVLVVLRLRGRRHRDRGALTIRRSESSMEVPLGLLPASRTVAPDQRLLMVSSDSWQTRQLDSSRDGQALDGASIWLLPRTPFSSGIYCELPGATTSKATFNLWIHETWYFISGVGELARWPLGDTPSAGTVVPVSPGLAVTIPPQVNFQYRSTKGTLAFLCFVAPPWPDESANQVSEAEMWSRDGD